MPIIRKNGCEEESVRSEEAPKKQKRQEGSEHEQVKYISLGAQISKKARGLCISQTTKMAAFELDEMYWFIERKPKTETRENMYLTTMVSRLPRQVVGVDVAYDKSRNGFKELWTELPMRKNTAPTVIRAMSMWFARDDASAIPAIKATPPRNAACGY